MKCECGCGGDTPIAKRTSTAKGWVKGEPLRFILGHNRRKPRKSVDEKMCSACRVIYPAADFYVDSSKPDGLSSSCRTCRKANASRWYAANTARARAANEQWQKANAEQYREAKRRWQHAHPQKRAEIEGRRRANKRRGRVERIDPAAIYKRDGGRCHICGKKVPYEKMTLDHLVPIVHGGDHVALNVRVAHRSCNSQRGPGRIPAQLLLT